MGINKLVKGMEGKCIHVSLVAKSEILCDNRKSGHRHRNERFLL